MALAEKFRIISNKKQLTQEPKKTHHGSVGIITDKVVDFIDEWIEKEELYSYIIKNESNVEKLVDLFIRRLDDDIEYDRDQLLAMAAVGISAVIAGYESFNAGNTSAAFKSPLKIKNVDDIIQQARKLEEDRK